MQINPYLIFDGNCEAAFKFYAQCLQGEIEMMMRFGEMPDSEQIPAQARDRIAHARLVAAGQVLMASDSHPSQTYQGIRGCSVSVKVDSPADAERIFNALVAGGTVQMPLAETFWAQRFGMLVDRFGVSWMVNCEKPA